MNSAFPSGTLHSVYSMLAATLYQLNSDRNHILWNIVSTERYTFYMQVFMECCYKWKVHNGKMTLFNEKKIYSSDCFL